MTLKGYCPLYRSEVADHLGVITDMTVKLTDNGIVGYVPNCAPGTIQNLSEMLATVVDLELAVLIGSRAIGNVHPDSDWDIALQWNRGIDFIQQLAATEQLRGVLVKAIDVQERSIDLIDIPSARLAMRAVVAEEGIPLKGGDSLAWHRFLQRTWRELEEQYWEKIYAA